MEAMKPDSTAKSIAEQTGVGMLGGGIVGGATGFLGPVIGKGIRLGVGAYKSINPTVKDALFRAIKPVKSNVMFDKHLDTAIPTIYQTSKEMGKDIAHSSQPLQDLVDVVGQAKKNIWSSWQQLIGPVKKATINGNKIADNIEKGVTDWLKIHNPAAAERITAFAQNFRKPLTLEKSEEYVEALNNELHTYYAKNKVGQNVLKNDPESNYLITTVESLRDALYSKLGELRSDSGKQLKQLYGSLSNIQNEVQGRNIVSSRQAPMSLQEQINYPMAVARGVAGAARGDFRQAAEGLAQVAISRGMKEMNTSEELIRRAFQKLEQQFGKKL